MHQLLDDMADTMYQANGVGLAAPQVGVLRRAVVVDVGDGLIELINPEIIKAEGEQTDAEGCLSYPEEYGPVSYTHLKNWKSSSAWDATSFWKLTSMAQAR